MDNSEKLCATPLRIDNLSNYDVNKWWRQQMEIFSALLSLCEWNHRSPVDSPHKGQCRGAFVLSFMCIWTNAWANNRDADDLRPHGAHCDVTVMWQDKHVKIYTLRYFVGSGVKVVFVAQLQLLKTQRRSNMDLFPTYEYITLLLAKRKTDDND